MGNFTLGSPVLSSGRITFKVLVGTQAVESFLLLFEFGPEILSGGSAISVTGPAGWMVVSNLEQTGRLEVGGATLDDQALSSGATLLTLSMALANLADREVVMGLSGTYNDQDGLVPQSSQVLSAPLGSALQLNVISWGAQQRLLAGVNISTPSDAVKTDSTGTAKFEGLEGTRVALEASKALSPAEAQAAQGAVDLQDAIAILKMIVGLQVPTEAQSHAADFDADGSVTLSDAIAVLKHVVGLDAPEPAYVFLEAGQAAAVATQPLEPGPPNSSLQISLDTETVQINLVGVLRGDVDGSFLPPPGP